MSLFIFPIESLSVYVVDNSCFASILWRLFPQKKNHSYCIAEQSKCTQNCIQKKTDSSFLLPEFVCIQTFEIHIWIENQSRINHSHIAFIRFYRLLWQSAIKFMAKPVKVRWKCFDSILVLLFFFSFAFVLPFGLPLFFCVPSFLFWILFDLLHCVSFILLSWIYSCGSALHMIRLLWKYLRFFVCFRFCFPPPLVRWNFCYNNFSRLKPHVNWQWMRCQHKFVDFLDKYSRTGKSQMHKNSEEKHQKKSRQ